MPAISRNNAEHYFWGGECDGWHLLKSNGLSVIEERVPPGGSEAKHYHQHSHQFFYILSGHATLEIEDRRHVLSPHEGFSVQPRVSHRLLNETPEDLSFLVISAPMSHGDRVTVD